YLIAISGSPQEIVEPFAKNLGFDKVIGRLFAADKQDRYTGTILNEKEIENKETILKSLLASNARLTLKGSVGIGDTNLDISFLKLLDHPVAFNPNKELFSHAK